MYRSYSPAHSLPSGPLKLQCHSKILSSNGAADTRGIGLRSSSLRSFVNRLIAALALSEEALIAKLLYIEIKKIR